MNKYQEAIKQFAIDRNWNQFHNPKDLLLGVVEEIGELRNIIKWEQDPKILKKVLIKNKEEVKDGIGDIYWFLALLANSAGVDINEAIEMTIEDNKKRFPIKKTKGKHTNLHLGGHDGKYKK
jgi:NTP pyrophosphatase (non-canonical NTP hydrolase)